jgi:hypothetical protein
MHPAILIGLGAVAGRALGNFYDSLRQAAKKVELASQRAAVMANRHRIAVHQASHPASQWEQLPARRVPWRG